MAICGGCGKVWGQAWSGDVAPCSDCRGEMVPPGPPFQPPPSGVSFLISGFDSLGANASMAASAIQNFGQAIAAFGGQSMAPLKPEPTATVWVAKDKWSPGGLKAIPVVKMTDGHLWLWIKYCRKKFRAQGFSGSDEALDDTIMAAMVTAPAIYREAAKRGVLGLEKIPAKGVITSTEPVTAAPGKRKIRLED